MMLLDYFGVFCWISGKMDEISKIWAISGALRCGVGIPRSSVGLSQGMAFPCRGVAEKGLGQASSKPQRSSAMPRRRPMSRRSYYSQLVDFCVLFCFLFRYSEDFSIGLMRTL